jgi:hypothetical protein
MLLIASLQKWLNLNGPELRFFPTITEMDWHHNKINDILVLDELARKAASLGEHHLAYRPITCHGRRQYPLAGRETVMKGSYSSDSSEVTLLGRRRDPRLLSFTNNSNNNSGKRKRCDDVESLRTYFHQEFISTSLSEIGELRVLIATEPDPQGVRGRSPTIIQIIHTCFNSKHQPHPHLALSGAEPFWQAVPLLTFHSLRQLAITYYTRLRQLSSWKTTMRRWRWARGWILGYRRISRILASSSMRSHGLRWGFGVVSWDRLRG